MTAAGAAQPSSWARSRPGDPRPLLVGEAPNPGRGGGGIVALSGRPARVICQATGWGPRGTKGDVLLAALRWRCRTVNVWDTLVAAEHATAGDWRAAGTDLVATELADAEEHGASAVVVALGRRVAAALGAQRGVRSAHPAPWGVLVALPSGLEVVAAPHPSAIAATDHALSATLGRAVLAACTRSRYLAKQSPDDVQRVAGAPTTDGGGPR